MTGEEPPAVSPVADLVPEPSARGWPRRLPIVIVVLVVMVIAAAVGVVLGRGSGSKKNVSWDPRLLSIVHFVEQQRGLTFKHPVPVRYLSQAAFNKKVTAPSPTSKSDKADLETAVAELRALGLVQKNIDLVAAENTLQQADIVGLYDPDTKEMYVRGSSLTVDVRVTLAHELTHALQDQYFDLTALEKKAPVGSEDAMQALIEGDAVRVNDAYVQTLSTADQKSYERISTQQQNEADKSTGSVPEVLSDELAFPYTFGPAFVDDLLQQGGNSSVDAAFRKPPVAEAQIANPLTYPLSSTPPKLSRPALPKGATSVGKPMAFGQVSLFEVLGSRLGYDTSWRAVQGWNSDDAVTYRLNKRTCLAVDEQMKSSSAATRLATAARRWSSVLTATTVTDSGAVVHIRSCDPGKGAPKPLKIQPTAFDVLSARAELIHVVVSEGHQSFETGACVADHVLELVGPQRYGILTSDVATSAQQKQILGYLRTSVSVCS